MNMHDPLPEDSADHHEPPLVATLADDPYEVFGLWMNVQLSQLVAKWEPLAAPNAKKAKQDFGRRFSAPHKAK